MLSDKANSLGGRAAYPVHGFHSPGLTKRELFAAMAMQGTLASVERGAEYNPKLGATYCLECADALLEELAK